MFSYESYDIYKTIWKPRTNVAKFTCQNPATATALTTNQTPQESTLRRKKRTNMHMKAPDAACQPLFFLRSFVVFTVDFIDVAFFEIKIEYAGITYHNII